MLLLNTNVIFLFALKKGVNLSSKKKCEKFGWLHTPCLSGLAVYSNSDLLEIHGISCATGPHMYG